MKALVLGSGIAGMSAATVLAHAGWEVDVYEMHDQPGGRCRSIEVDGFSFDMGPSWYWMPDVFERFYQRFGRTTADFYELVRLDPSYQVIFEEERKDLPADPQKLRELFEKWEPGSSVKLDKFLSDAAYKYEVGMRDLVYTPSFSFMEFADPRLLKDVFRLNLFSSLESEVRSLFKHKNIRKLLEFPVLFLGAKPKHTPALYSLMNHADMTLGTWYPMGGMVNISKAFAKIAEDQGVQFHFNKEISKIDVQDGEATAVFSGDEIIANFDLIISGADYHHTEQLLDKENRTYSDSYWDSRKLSPSCLLFYVGVDRKIENLQHHNLFFDADFSGHAAEIYDHPQWPTEPLFYVCAPSVTDQSVAPEGKENLFFLMPIAPDLNESAEIHEQYFDLMVDRVEKWTGQSFKSAITYKRSFGVQNFKDTYHSLKGNAYGLANTLTQTAFLKPKMKSKKVKNLYYCGQLTVPGPGLPPSIISGQVIADYILRKTPKNSSGV